MHASSSRLAAGTLIAGSLCFGTADLVRRLVLSDDAAARPDTMVAAVAAHPGVWLFAGSLALVAPVLMLPGVVALVRSVRSRGRVLAAIGGRLLTAGLLAALAHAVAFYGSVGVYPSSGLDASAVGAYDDATNRYPLLIAVIVVFVLGMALGPILLTIGLRRARRAAVWVPIAAVVFAVTGVVGGVAAGVVGLIAGAAAFTGASIGLRDLSQAAGGVGIEPEPAGEALDDELTGNDQRERRHGLGQVAGTFDRDPALVRESGIAADADRQ